MDSTNRANPFVLGGVVRGKQFAGRAQEIARVRRLAVSGQRVYLFAPRRYGKTSLLKQALDPEVERGRLILLWCDCLPISEAAELAQRVAGAVVHAARRSKLAEWAKAAGELFKQLRPALTRQAEGQVRVSVEVAPVGRGRADPGLEDALMGVGRLAARKRKPVVVVFDEFQQIAAWDREHRTEAVIRTVIQQQHGVAYAFAGSQRHLLQQMFADRARPLFQLAAPFPLGRLSPQELRPWLEERFRETGFELDGTATDALLSICAGHPWATQYLSHFVWEGALAAGAGRVLEEVVQVGLAQVVGVGATTYGEELGALTPAERRVMTAIALEPTESPTAVAYLRRHRLPAKSTVSQTLARLVDRGYLETEGETYVVSDPLFGEWIRRQ